jgi:hypothetical protein
VKHEQQKQEQKQKYTEWFGGWAVKLLFGVCARPGLAKSPQAQLQLLPLRGGARNCFELQRWLGESMLGWLVAWPRLCAWVLGLGLHGWNGPTATSTTSPP